MEFLVNIKITWPENWSPAQIEKVSLEERDHIKGVIAKGIMKRMWRVPGRRENWGLWEAKDATELHNFLSRLPVFPYMDIQVHPLAVHPVDPIKPKDMEVF